MPHHQQTEGHCCTIKVLLSNGVKGVSRHLKKDATCNWTQLVLYCLHSIENCVLNARPKGLKRSLQYGLIVPACRAVHRMYNFGIGGVPYKEGRRRCHIAMHCYC